MLSAVASNACNPEPGSGDRVSVRIGFGWLSGAAHGRAGLSTSDDLRSAPVLTACVARRLHARASSRRASAADPAPAQARPATTTTFSLYTHPCRASISRDRKGVPVAATDDTATLKYPGGELDLDIVHATEGADGIALGPLLAKTGYTTFDNGFVNTASTKSAITYIDGDAGILRYRGIPIEQLAEKSTFVEVSYLLIYGELPTTEQLAEFTRQIRGTRCCTRT